MFEKITNKLTKYACNNEGDKFADLFVDNGIYHDYIWKLSRKNIKLMLNNYFHRDAKSFYWKMYDHVFKDNKGYAKFRFSFTSKITQFKDKRVVVSGISFLNLI